MIKVQREEFDVGAELRALGRGNRNIGGIASFVGVVRNTAESAGTGAMTLEHYPGMTEKKLVEIETLFQPQLWAKCVLRMLRYCGSESTLCGCAQQISPRPADLSV